MVALRLTGRDREQLSGLARSSRSARETRRALALLDLDAGEPVARVAQRYRVGRSTVYEWAARWADATRPRGERLRDAARSGRPPGTRDGVQEVLAGLMPTAPTAHGYRHPSRTTPLLLAHLKRGGVEASDTTVRRALHRLGYRWKRPRFVLSRRAEHWRQAKGGSRPG
ncbi:helix-turn-helix domain-containing protein [bacterium]|nr:helix-turn-helix domain-containing protein [bacterium]